MNLRSKINKLQKALIKNGYIVKINTRQFYSKEQKRMITMYNAFHVIEICDKKGNSHRKDEEIIEATTSQSEVVKALSAIYANVVGAGDVN